MGLASTAKLLAELGLVDKLTPGLRKASGSLDKFESRLGRAAGGAGKLSAGFARAGTVIAGAAVTGFSAAAKATIDWEDAFAGVVKTVDETDLKSAGLTFDDISDSLRKMSLEMPNSAIELAGIAEQAGALGIKAKDIESFTKQVAIIAATTDVSADDAATALGQLQNVIGLTGDEFDNFAAALVDLGNKGASTESAILEIARRSGGAAHLIGVAKDATLAWASAAANLGLNQELAGTALQNFFVKSQTIVSSGKGLSEMARIAGEVTPAAFKKLSAAARKALSKDFAKAFDKDATGAMQRFLTGLGKLSKGERIRAVQSLFGKGSGLTRLVLGLAESVDQNLNPALAESAKAWDEATAAQIEFDKRNATVKSAFSRLKNGILDAAVSVGEGFTPALGRASEKLAAFLKDPVNREELKKLGEGIGKTIDEIDWDQVIGAGKDFVGVLKSAFDWAKRIWDVFNALPNEVKGATAGFLALNKLSGGLIAGGIGDIVGSLGGAVAKGALSKVPGLGALVAQPVFVTNWPMGGLGGSGLPGGAGAAGAGLAAFAVGTLVSGVGLAAALAITDKLVNEPARQGKAAENIDATKALVGRGNPEEIRRAIDNLSTMPDRLDPLQRALYDLNANGVKTHNEDLITYLKDSLQPAIQAQQTETAREGRKGGAFGGGSGSPAALPAGSKELAATTAAVQESKREATKGYALLSGDNAKQKAAIDAAKLAIDGAKRATEYGASGTQAKVAAAAGAITGAIMANRPMVTTTVNVNVSAAGVSKSVTEQNRYGPGNGSAGGGGPQHGMGGH